MLLNWDARDALLGVELLAAPPSASRNGKTPIEKDAPARWPARSRLARTKPSESWGTRRTAPSNMDVMTEAPPYVGQNGRLHLLKDR
eukprot:9466783-Pyramimonas_sp.AAC.1